MNERNKVKGLPEAERKDRKVNRINKLLYAMGAGSIVDLESFSQKLPFIFFLVLLAWFHIGNNHRAVDYIRTIGSLEREIKELRWEYMTEKSQLMHDSKQSEVALKVKDQGLKELRNPPHIIDIEN